MPTAELDAALAASGKINAGAHQFVIARAERIVEHGAEIPPAAGMATAINFQPTGNGGAAIRGHFVLLASEVNPVIRELRAGGIDVTALHSHMLEEEPRFFFMHFWANDDALKLALRFAPRSIGRTALGDRYRITRARRRSELPVKPHSSIVITASKANNIQCDTEVVRYRCADASSRVFGSRST